MFRISHQVERELRPSSLDASLLTASILFVGGKVCNALSSDAPEPNSSQTQMIKGVRTGGIKAALSYLDTLEVPIIENTPYEEDLNDSMADAMKQYPDAAAVLVRRHGIYVWGTASSSR